MQHVINSNTTEQTLRELQQQKEDVRTARCNETTGEIIGRKELAIRIIGSVSAKQIADRLKNENNQLSFQNFVYAANKNTIIWFVPVAHWVQKQTYFNLIGALTVSLENAIELDNTLASNIEQVLPLDFVDSLPKMLSNSSLIKWGNAEVEAETEISAQLDVMEATMLDTQCKQSLLLVSEIQYLQHYSQHVKRNLLAQYIPKFNRDANSHGKPVSATWHNNDQASVAQFLIANLRLFVWKNKILKFDEQDRAYVFDLVDWNDPLTFLGNSYHFREAQRNNPMQDIYNYCLSRWPQSMQTYEHFKVAIHNFIQHQPTNTKIQMELSTSLAKQDQHFIFDPFLRAIKLANQKCQKENWQYKSIDDLYNALQPINSQILPEPYRHNVIEFIVKCVVRKRLSAYADKAVEALPIFVGRQGTGKSTLTKMLSLHFATTITDIADINSQRNAQLRASYVLLESSELVNRANDDATKASLSMNYIPILLKYSNEQTFYNSRALIIATTNRPDILSDTENRRIWPIEMAKYDWSKITDQFVLEVYASEFQKLKQELEHHMNSQTQLDYYINHQSSALNVVNLTGVDNTQQQKFEHYKNVTYSQGRPDLAIVKAFMRDAISDMLPLNGANRTDHAIQFVTKFNKQPGFAFKNQRDLLNSFIVWKNSNDTYSKIRMTARVGMLIMYLRDYLNAHLNARCYDSQHKQHRAIFIAADNIKNFLDEPSLVDQALGK